MTTNEIIFTKQGIVKGFETLILGAKALEEVSGNKLKSDVVLMGMDLVAGTVNDLLGKLMNEPNGKELTKKVAKEVSAMVKKSGNEKYFAMVILITGGII